MQLHRRSKIQKMYCNPEGFLCSFSIYNCLRNSISLSSITIVSSCLWLYFIQLKSYRVHRLSIHGWIVYLSVQFSSITQSCPTLCSLMNLSMPGLPVHHQLPEFTQIHVHQVSDAIQPSHPLSSPSPPAPNPSQHQSLFQWVNSSHEVAKVSALASFLPKKSQGWYPSEWTGWISLQSKGLSRVFSNTTVQKHQFFGAQLSL